MKSLLWAFACLATGETILTFEPFETTFAPPLYNPNSEYTLYDRLLAPECFPNWTSGPDISFAVSTTSNFCFDERHTISFTAKQQILISFTVPGRSEALVLFIIWDNIAMCLPSQIELLAEKSTGKTCEAKFRQLIQDCT